MDKTPEKKDQLAITTSTTLLIASLKSESIPDLILAENKLSVAVALGAPTIRSIKKSIGERDLLKVVSFMIRACIANFNVTTKPNDEQMKIQIYTMANDLINKYPNEALEDFAMCFKKARNFEFGSTFNRVDSETIFGWMGKHLEANASEREVRNHNMKHPKQTKEPVRPLEFVDPKNKEHYEAVQNIAKQLRTGQYKSVKDIFPKADIPTHESFIEGIKKRIKIMSDPELDEYLKNASMGKLSDVIKIINEEKERRSL